MSENQAGDSSCRWLPLESNPDVINKYMKNIGVDSKWHVVDVYGCEPDLLGMISKPVAALFFLYPITEKTEAEEEALAKKLKADGYKMPTDLFFMKQKIGNACGTFALIHALANNADKIEFANGPLKKFIEASKSLSPEERSALLEQDKEMTSAHESSAQEGQTEAPPRDEKINLHFISFINHNGTLYEMDGRNDFPFPHGSTTDDSLLQDAAEVCKKYIARDPENLRFTMMALSGGAQAE